MSRTSSAIPGASSISTDIDTEALIIGRRAAIDRGQHWSSPYAARRVHLIGIGGCGMSGLAGVLLRCGAIVSGSDRIEGKSMRRLVELGARIAIGQAPINIPSDCDLVVYSAAINEDNPELLEARRRGIRRMKYAEMLGQVMRLRTGIAVAGTHGKSTTTALLSYILRQAKLDPTFVVGADVRQLGGGAGVGDGPHFVVEACEFDRSFLNLLPKYSAILNIEEDHLDCFPNLEAIIETFRAFASLVPPDGIIIANGEDRAVSAAVENARGTVETFGFGDHVTWQATDITHDKGCYAFNILRDGESFMRASMDRLPGRHQVANGTAAAALAYHAGVEKADIAAALSTFTGADRRLTHRGDVNGITLLDDYGHHPTEVQVTLRAVREHYPDRRLWLVFQPHQHSRTRFLLKDFALSFGQADHVLVPDIYFVRDSQAERDAICSGDLVDRVRANGGDALYLPTLEIIVEHVVERARPGDVVLTMGAGDVWKIADELIRRLG